MLTGLSTTMIALMMAAGLGLDWLLGEARRWHPLVGFGNYANTIERRMNGGQYRTLRGLIAWSLAVLPLVILAYCMIQYGSRLAMGIGATLDVLLLYFSLGLRSLRDHTVPIAQALGKDDLPAARALTARIVSRDTTDADSSDLAKATVESLLENGNDAVFGTLFWFVIAGGTGALLFRLANTLDAMWGYRTPRFEAFGCVAARLDDALNWLPARLTALSYALLGDTRLAMRCWSQQAPTWSSPNAGPVMASGAGALALSLGGDALYHGMIEHRPALGHGPAATATDIGRAWRLVLRTTMLWLVVTSLVTMVLFLSHHHD
jgi:adenosylcobinamide-phosphate synthase